MLSGGPPSLVDSSRLYHPAGLSIPSPPLSPHAPPLVDLSLLLCCFPQDSFLVPALFLLSLRLSTNSGSSGLSTHITTEAVCVT